MGKGAVLLWWDRERGCWRPGWPGPPIWAGRASVLEYLGGAVTTIIGDEVDAGSYTSPIYGQPIVWHNNTYNVIIGLFSRSWEVTAFGIIILTLASQEWVFLYDLVGNLSVYSQRRVDFENSDLNLKMLLDSDNNIQGLDWVNANKDNIRYIGHKGVGVLGYGSKDYGVDNPLNPNVGGSNYEINNFNSL